MSTSLGIFQTCRALLMTLALCAVFAGSADADWDTLGTSFYSSSTVSDGHRFVAFQPDDRHVTVFDAAHGNGAVTYLIPQSCAPDGYAFVRALGGGQLLVECRSPMAGVSPMLLTLALGVWHEVPLLSSLTAQAATVGFGAVGASWLERRTAGAHTEWVNWHTNEIQSGSPDESRVPDPDRSELYVEHCSGVRPASSPYAYETPFAVVQSPHHGLRLQRCGLARSLPVDPETDSTYGLRLADGIVTWATLHPIASAGAYLVDCHVSLRWRQPSGGSIVHAGRTLVRTFVPDKYGNPANVERLRLPSGCPRSPVAQPLQVGQVGRRRTSVQPDLARWRISDAWGAAQARIEPGTFRPGRIVLQRGTTLAIDAVAARSVRWSADGVAWKRARRADDRWTVRFGDSVPRRLRLALRLDDGGTAEYRLNVTVRSG